MPNSKFSKKQIEKAGKILASSDPNSSEYHDAFEVLCYWRESFGRPLKSLFDIAQKCSCNISNSIVVGRIKRETSIINKLQRKKDSCNLRTLQDIAGCRIIVDDTQQVYEILEYLINSSDISNSVKLIHDYIQEPKVSGYRGIHVIFSFMGDNGYDKLRAELQIRTRSQHIWATCVEAFDAARKTDIKINYNKKSDYCRYFMLTSELINCTEFGIASEVNVGRLINQIENLNNNCNIEKILTEFNDCVTLDNIYDSYKPGYYVLRLSNTSQILFFECFANQNFNESCEKYFACEKIHKNSTHLFTLIRGENTLEIAFPNYFSNIDAYFDLLKQHRK